MITVMMVIMMVMLMLSSAPFFFEGGGVMMKTIVTIMIKITIVISTIIALVKNRQDYCYHPFLIITIHTPIIHLASVLSDG